MNTQNETLKEYIKDLEASNKLKKANKKYAQDLQAMGVTLYFIEGAEE